MEEITIGKWADFINLASSFGNEESVFQPLYVFRGQSDQTFQLRPSLLRYLSSETRDLMRSLQTEKHAMIAFQRQASIHLPNINLPTAESATLWWILMQHYGVPTRLLDWTRSPFVALYFAVERDFDKAGAIWIVRMPALVQAMKEKFSDYKASCSLVASDVFREIDPRTHTTLHFIDSRQHTNRMAAQQTAVSVSPYLLADHHQILTESLLTQGSFIKLTIPPDKKKQFLRNLHSANITACTLFPGIDGLGKSVAELIKLDCQGCTS